MFACGRSMVSPPITTLVAVDVQVCLKQCLNSFSIIMSQILVKSQHIVLEMRRIFSK